ncbi:MAG: hypothetical protein IPL39_08555 [Opitutaceae bacterium]|nr:hypothetical protein [Opitutaceae bacterium]
MVAVGDLAVHTRARTPAALDPGWNNVISPNGSSGVYLGNRWVITAGHVMVPASVPIGGILFEVESNSDVRMRRLDNADWADLQLFRLKTAPALPAIALIDSPLAVGTEITLIGFGGWCGEAAAFDANWNSVPVEASAPYTGYWRSGWGKCWGTNRVSGITDFDDGAGLARVYTAVFDAPGAGSDATADEALIAPSDSGGAIFAQVNGQWRLAGTMIDLAVVGGRNWFLPIAVHGDWTYAVELAAYRPQIDAVLACATQYDVWQYKIFRGTATSVTADPDGDGFTNLEEYAYGLDPKVRNPRSAAPQIGFSAYADGSALTVTFTRNKLATDALPVVEVSDDLVTWSSGAGATVELPSVALAGDVERATVRDATPLAKAPRRFLRVRVAR